MEEELNQPPAPIDRQPQPEPKAPKNSALHQYRWVVLVACILIGSVLAVYVWHNQSNATKATVTVKSQTVSTPTVKTTSTPQSSNSWVATVNPKALFLGDGKVTTSPQVGSIYSCTTSFRGGGARHAGNWINTTNNTWDSTAKVSVLGSVDWPSASYANSVSGTNRIITTNDLPSIDPTGIFPIGQSDPAYQYDTNPNHISNQSVNLSLALNPMAAASPNCVGLGYIGVMNNGVLLFNALDDAGRDAVAHETQDTCSGHPDGQERYHYHDVASCIRNRATVSSTLVGYALDGYGMYVERDIAGNLPTNADLDVCHGRTSQVEWNGSLTSIYHYDATLEYPYTIGCYHGTPITNRP